LRPHSLASGEDFDDDALSGVDVLLSSFWKEEKKKKKKKRKLGR